MDVRDKKGDKPAAAHSIPVGGDDAPIRCLPTANKHHKEQDEEGRCVV